MTNNKTKPHLYFPHHLVISIFEYLPVRSLIRFRCVSKTFSSLIHKPSFLSSHLIKHSNSNISKYPKTVLYHFPALGDYFTHLTLYNDSSVSPCVVYDFSGDFQCCCAVGYSNGVVCLLDCINSIFHFWNPLFNKSVNHKLESKLMSSLCFGFGYDSKTNYFKFVHVFHDEQRNQVFSQLYGISGTGYTKNISTWRIYSIAPPQGFRYYFVKNSVVYVNGGLHWLGRSWVHQDHDETSRNHILSFNVEDEVFREFDLPERVRQGYDNSVETLREVKVTEFKGMLCVFPRWFDLPYVWVMKEYGKAETWVPLVNIASSRICKFCEVVDLKDEEEEEFWVIRHHGRCTLCVFNQKTGKLIKHRRILGSNSLFRGSFMESFALMDVDDEACPPTTPP